MSLKQFVNDKQTWDEFMQYLDELIAIEHSRLAASEHPVELHRAQGAVNAYKKLKYLREKMNNG